MSPRQVLVAGYGMAAARLADEIRARDPDGTRVTLTIAGAEPVPAYNRLLLTAVLAGRLTAPDTTLHEPGWAREHQAQIHTGVAVTAVDRGRRRAVLADGTEAGYDDLVLATGSHPVLPPVAGLAGPGGGPAAGVTTFRNVSDCERILAAASAGAGMAVVGGGLLGLEAARGLAARDVKVTVVHVAGHLMERQLDGGAGRALAHRLTAMGIDLRLGVAAERWIPGTPGTLQLADGTALEADAVVVTAGVRPQTSLAARAGLRTGTGILVDNRLTTSDPAIRAIGDCAEHPGTTTGIVQPAWEQAAVLADLLTGAGPDSRYHGTPAVTRLKADGIELASMGDPYAEHDELTETLRVEDPGRGLYGKLALRGDRVAGAVMLGLPDAAAAVTQLYDRGAPAPSDRLALLLGRALPAADAGQAGPGADVTALPGHAVVCRCSNVTKSGLAAAWRQGARSVPDLAAATRATSGCGGCSDQVEGIAGWLEDMDQQDQSASGAGSR